MPKIVLRQLGISVKEIAFQRQSDNLIGIPRRKSFCDNLAFLSRENVLQRPSHHPIGTPSRSPFLTEPETVWRSRRATLRLTLNGSSLPCPPTPQDSVKAPSARLGCTRSSLSGSPRRLPRAASSPVPAAPKPTGGGRSSPIPDATHRRIRRWPPALRPPPRALDLGVLTAAFREIGPKTIESWVRAEPTGAFSRRAWFWYETLLGRILDLEDGKAGNYVAALDPARHFVAAPRRSRRHRVADNLLGGPVSALRSGGHAAWSRPWNRVWMTRPERSSRGMNPRSSSAPSTTFTPRKTHSSSRSREKLRARPVPSVS